MLWARLGAPLCVCTTMLRFLRPLASSPTLCPSAIRPSRPSLVQPSPPVFPCPQAKRSQGRTLIVDPMVQGVENVLGECVY